MSQELCWSQIADGVVGPQMVVGVLLRPAEGRPEGGQAEVALVALIELLGVGPLKPAPDGH